MTQDEIIEMARQADSGFEGGENADGTMGDSIVGIEAVVRFAKLVAAKEREACAKDVEAAYTLGLPYDDVATAIRARGGA
jgi:hypothetical protein